jgi:broad specificity phosphatase PhoE
MFAGLNKKTRLRVEMKVTFLRHAISIFNEMNTSEKDCELSEAGKAQARGLEGSYDLVICSIMTRTKQTLAFSQIKYKELIYSHICREFRTTICDYLPHEDENIPETRESLHQRIELFRDFVKSNGEGKRVLVVSHGDFIFAMNGETKYPDNAEFQELEI